MIPTSLSPSGSTSSRFPAPSSFSVAGPTLSCEKKKPGRDRDVDLGDPLRAEELHHQLRIPLRHAVHHHRPLAVDHLLARSVRQLVRDGREQRLLLAARRSRPLHGGALRATAAQRRRGSRPHGTHPRSRRTAIAWLRSGGTPTARPSRAPPAAPWPGARASLRASCAPPDRRLSERAPVLAEPGEGSAEARLQHLQRLVGASNLRRGLGPGRGGGRLDEEEQERKACQAHGLTVLLQMSIDKPNTVVP